MVERLSAKDFFMQMLERHVERLDIDIYGVDYNSLDMEVTDKYIKIKTPPGFILKLTTPALVNAAQLANLEEANQNSYQERRDLLLELFAKEKVYRGLTERWKEYEIKTANIPLSKLEARLDKVNNVVGKHLASFREYMGYSIYKSLTRKMPYIEFEEGLSNMDERAIMNLLVDTSMRAAPSVKLVNRQNRNILVPYTGQNEV